MEKAEIELEVLTPMFSYGNKEVEFRLTELKSLMRSTFRELYYFEKSEDIYNEKKNGLEVLMENHQCLL